MKRELGAEPAGRAGSPSDVLGGEKMRAFALKMIAQAELDEHLRADLERDFLDDVNDLARAYLELVESRGEGREALEVRCARLEAALKQVPYGSAALQHIWRLERDEANALSGPPLDTPKVTQSNSVREALENIAKQELSADMTVDQQLDGDFEGAYNHMIEIAREALSPTDSGSVGKGSAALSSEGEEG